MNEISNRVFTFFDGVAREQGVDIDALVEGFDVEVAELRDPRGRFSWALLAAMSERLEARLGRDAMRILSRGFGRTEVAAPLRPVAGLLVSPAFAYKALFGWLARSYYRHADFAVAEVAGGRIDIEIRIRDGHQDAPAAWFLLFAGGLEALPTLGGMGQAHVEVALSPRGARFLVTPPKRRLRDRLRAAASVLSLGAAFDALAQKEEDLHAADLERARAAAEAQRSEQFARVVLERVDEVIAIVDREGRVRFSSPASARILGYEPGSQLGQSGFDLVHPDDRARIATAFAECLSKPGLTVSADFRIRAHGGAWRDFDVSATNLLEDPVIEGVLVNARDTSARMAAERALSAREHSFAVLLGNLQGMAYRCRNDPAWTMELASPGAVVVTGYEVDELVGNRVVTFADLIHPDDAGPLWEKCQVNLDARRPCNNEYRIRHKDGQWRWVVDVAAGVYDDAGTLLAIEGFLTDVTARHLLEERLAQAQRLEGVGRLAGGIAHDFNNLIGAMLAYAELAGEALPEGSPAAADIEEIKAAALRAGDLTRQLLAFARRQVLQPKVLDLNEQLSSVERLLRRVIGEDVVMVTSGGAALWPVEADPGQLEQVLLNLAVNARDAMPGGGTLTLATSNVHLEERRAVGDRELAPGDYVSLVVRDTGVGMDEETQRHIFEPFFSTKGGMGTGLGLATSYGLISQLGGALAVSSAVGEGSTFTVYLPRSNKALDEPIPAAPKRLSKGGEVVLLVEDHAQLRDSMQRALEGARYRVVAAGDPAEALGLLSDPAFAVDLLLTDVIMPGKSGPELVEHARRGRPAMPVLYVSGYVEDRVAALKALDARSAFLAKPFDLAELCNNVRELLDRVQ